MPCLALPRLALPTGAEGGEGGCAPPLCIVSDIIIINQSRLENVVKAAERVGGRRGPSLDLGALFELFFLFLRGQCRVPRHLDQFKLRGDIFINDDGGATVEPHCIITCRCTCHIAGIGI